MNKKFFGYVIIGLAAAMAAFIFIAPELPKLLWRSLTNKGARERFAAAIENVDKATAPPRPNNGKG